MNNIFQTTLSKKVSFKGIGLHSGENSTINLHPAKEDKRNYFLKELILSITTLLKLTSKM